MQLLRLKRHLVPFVIMQPLKNATLPDRFFTDFYPVLLHQLHLDGLLWTQLRADVSASLS